MSFDIALEHRIGEREIALAFASDARLTALVGPSGAGKTTVLNCIAGLIRPDAGRIAVGGVVLVDSEAGVDLPPETRRAGYVFQQGRLFPHMRVGANLAYGERLAKPEDRWIGRAEVLEFLGIGHLLDRWPDTLSGGEMRRVAIGRALLAAPKFLLLDEPLTSLDAARREGILRVVERIRDELKLPILYVSHDVGEVERLTQTVIRLEQGEPA
jgi:molybdate transport system ATP-binding protein